MVSFQVLSNPNEDEVLAEIQRFALIFVGIGIFSGISNFMMVSDVSSGYLYASERYLYIPRV